MAHFTKNFALFCVMLICTSMVVLARPNRDSNSWNSISSDLKYCAGNMDVQEVCQRCAKVTKSDIVYPMCCENEDNGYVWCVKYLNFGLQ